MNRMLEERWNEAKTQFNRIIHSDISPHSISLGFAVGMFFGFSPLMGIKTISTVAVAWLLRGNRAAAVGALCLHDIAFPLLPAIIYAEYKIGYFLIGTGGHDMVMHVLEMHNKGLSVQFYKLLDEKGLPYLSSSLVMSIAGAVISYFICRFIVYLIAKSRKGVIK